MTVTAAPSGVSTPTAVGHDVVTGYAEKRGVCARPVVRQVVDRTTGHVERLVLPCGSTRESRCRPCAEKAQRLRMQQCSEGWHLVDDPLKSDPTVSETPSQEGKLVRRARSTRRRADVVELPRVPAENRTVGRTFASPDGQVYRPSMFVTLTLGSYGRVVAGRGIPDRHSRYDYARAAREALLFPRLVDRWIQNLRRCAGYRVQYFGAIEPQRRLAPHIHLALRGAIPREVLRDVTRATYLQLWWPSFGEPVHVDEIPMWDPEVNSYRDPGNGVVLATWEEALDAVEEPAFVMRFGRQLDIKGIVAPSADADRSVRYLTKYLTKSVAETYTDDEHLDPQYEAHIDRLHVEVQWLPCSPACANWLRYGVQPKDAGPGLVPGLCRSKGHERENLGIGGRRVQVSRHWSGKTLQEHRADRAAVVRAVLEEAGFEVPDTRRMSADVPADDGLPRFVWEPVSVASADYVAVVVASVTEQLRWRTQYEKAKQLVASRAGPDPPP